MHIWVNIFQVLILSPPEINSPVSNVSCCNTDDYTCKMTKANNAALTATSVSIWHVIVNNLVKKY